MSTNHLTLSLEHTSLGEANEYQSMHVKVTDAEGNGVLLIFAFEPGDSITCTQGADKLTGVYSGSHLCALVGSFLWELFGPDHDFLSDVFFLSLIHI